MIRRIVKMTFKEGNEDKFLEIFKNSGHLIRAFDGCHGVDLLRATQSPNIFFTYSHWESEDHLNTYRHSELFQTTWASTKALFADKAEAWSVEVQDL